MSFEKPTSPERPRIHVLFALFTPALLLLGLAWLVTPAGMAAAQRLPKVEVCHVPPDNPGNAHTINVSENALPAHLAHGDFGVGEACSEGAGECRTEGTTQCDAADSCSAVPGKPSDEICDGLDNDCDGAVDEDLGTTRCGLGVCDHESPNCVEGTPQVCDPLEGASAEICGNALDEDCDGDVDTCEPVVRVWNPEWATACRQHCIVDLGDRLRRDCETDPVLQGQGVDCGAGAADFVSRCLAERCTPFTLPSDPVLLSLAVSAAQDFGAPALHLWDSQDYLGPDGQPSSRLYMFTTRPGVPDREEVSAMLAEGRTHWDGTRWEDLFRAVEVGLGDLLPPVIGYWEGLPADLALEQEGKEAVRSEQGAVLPHLVRRHATALFPVLEYQDPTGTVFFDTAGRTTSRELVRPTPPAPDVTPQAVARRVQHRDAWNARLEEVTP
jgi:hypothetical protein